VYFLSKRLLIIHCLNEETLLSSVLFAFSALTLLVWRQKQQPACKKPTDEVVCVEQGANDLHIARLMPLTPRHLLLH